jgi:predicted Rossmann fold nucleotide-binding protein DprA/Smf involved in DNA uptake
MNEVDVLSLDSFRSVRDTIRALTRLQEPYPTFVHKWTRASRPYRWDELALPQSVIVSGGPCSYEAPVIGIGGTRSCTVETFCLVSRVARLLAQEGWVILSGGVPGVDMAAHLAAIEVQNGQTIAVMSNPPDLGLAGHEWSNALVSDMIKQKGAFISEYEDFVSIGTPAQHERLLQRDRIISGMCDVFIAFECNMHSATVDTAYRALAQGKSVLGISPAHPTLRKGIEWLALDSRVEIINEAANTDKDVLDKVGSMIKKSLINDLATGV